MDKHTDIQKILEYRNLRNRFCRRLGITITELTPGHAKVVKEICEEDLNPLGFAHGGVYFTMADNAAGAAMAAYGDQAVTVSAQYNFFHSAAAGDILTAEAREIKHGETICVYDVYLTDQNSTAVGSGTFSFFNLKKPLKLE